MNDKKEILSEECKEAMKNLPPDINPVDGAQFFLELSESNEVILPLCFRRLPKGLAADIFSYMDNDLKTKLILSFSEGEVTTVMSSLAADDAAHTLEELPANVVDRILRYIPKEKRKHINDILSYPEDSAGSVMTVEYIDLRPEMTVEDALDKIRTVGLDKETIYNCYVTESRKLKGVVSARQLLTSDKTVVLSDIMECNVISVFTEEDKEIAVQRLSKYDLDALPVVDRESRLVGIVTFDDAIEIIQEEATEDMEKMAAIVPSEKPYLRTGVFSAYTKRVPWLLFLMLSATFTGKILGFFEAALSTELALTMFIPMLMDTGGNAGGQASMMIMRGLSLGEISPRDYFRIAWKEIRIAVLCGLTLAAATFLKVMFIDRLSMGIAATVCLTLAAAVVLAKFIGASLPMLAKALKFDPAVMASPLITTIVDAISLIVYFNIAKAILHL